MGISVDDITALAAPVVRAAGLDLEDVQVAKVGKREKLTVIVDADGGVDLDAIADVSSALSAELDAREEVVSSPYVLEVTSPGVDRPLTEPRHWRRAKDRLVAVTLTDGTALTGRVTSSDDTSALLEVDGSERDVAFADVDRAIVQVEFDRKDS